MALNDKAVENQGTGTYPDVSNPTKSSVSNDPMANSFVDDPTKTETGAGAGEGSCFSSAREAKRAMRGVAGVVEARPGIIEDTHIDPLSETSNDDDGWANVPRDSCQSESSATQKVASTLDSAKDVATGAAKVAYETGAAHVEGGETLMEGKSQ